MSTASMITPPRRSEFLHMTFLAEAQSVSFSAIANEYIKRSLTPKVFSSSFFASTYGRRVSEVKQPP